MKYLFLIFLIFLFSNGICEKPIKIKYFEAIRKDNVYFSWLVESQEKYLTYVIQGSHDKLFFEDILTYRCENKEFKTHQLTEFIYFRLKILTSKDCFIYSDIVYCKSNSPIRIFPDPNGNKIVYITSIEDGSVYFYHAHQQVLDTTIVNGHNIIEHCLNPGEYNVMVFTENYKYEIKIKVR